MNKVIHTLEANLYRLEKKESEELNKLAKDEAIRISLYLNNHPAPPMPEFPISKDYEDAEKLADVVDDIFSKRLDDKNDALVDSKEYEKELEEEFETLTDAEALRVCGEWKEKYNVVIGVSWGNLPYDLQQKWLEYSCDYHLHDEGSHGSSLENKDKEPTLD